MYKMELWEVVEQEKQVKESIMKVSGSAKDEVWSDGESVEIIVSCSDSADASEMNRKLSEVGDQTQEEEGSSLFFLKEMVPDLGCNLRIVG